MWGHMRGNYLNGTHHVAFQLLENVRAGALEWLLGHSAILGSLTPHIYRAYSQCWCTEGGGGGQIFTEATSPGYPTHSCYYSDAVCLRPYEM